MISIPMTEQVRVTIKDKWIADKNYPHDFTSYLKDKYYCAGYSQTLLYFESEHHKTLFLLKL